MTIPRKEQRGKDSDARSVPKLDHIEARGGLASIQDILKRWLKDHKVSRHCNIDILTQRWNVIVGSPIANHSRLAEFSHGELLVEVNSAALLNELSTYYRKEILESLRPFDEFRGIQRIRFRPGSF